MSKAAAAISAGVKAARVGHLKNLLGKTPTTRRTPLAHKKGALVTDKTTGQIGVVLSGKKKHVPTQSPA
jgi:hypothetical protein